MKRFFSVMLALLLTFAVVTIPASAAGTLNVKGTSNYCDAIAASNYDLGDVAVLTFTMPEARNIESVELGVSYNKNVLRLTGISTFDKGDIVIKTDEPGAYPITGKLGDSKAPYKLNKGDTIITLVFDVIGSGSATVDLHIINMTVSDSKGKYKLFVNGVRQSGVPEFSDKMTISASSNYCTAPNPKTVRLGDRASMDFTAPEDCGIVELRFACEYDEGKLDWTGISTFDKGAAMIFNHNSSDYPIEGHLKSSSPYYVKKGDSFITVVFEPKTAGAENVNLKIIDLTVRTDSGDKVLFKDGVDKRHTRVSSVGIRINEPKAWAKPNYWLAKDNPDCDFYVGRGLLCPNGTGVEYIDHSKGEPEDVLTDVTKYMTKDETFQPGVTYTARIFLTTMDREDTYFSPSFTASVNNERAAVGTDLSGGKETIVWIDYTVTIPKSGSGYMIGDADADKDITILDATAIQRYIAELPNKSFDKNAADADEDGDVTILDATAIQRYVAELPTEGKNIGKYA